MKQYFTGFFTAVCLTASVFIFMGSQNKNLGDIEADKITITSELGTTTIIGGAMILRNKDDKNVLSIAVSDGKSGQLTTFNADGKQTIYLGTGKSGGGFLETSNVDGKKTAHISNFLITYNTDGKKTSYLGTSVGGSGSLMIYNMEEQLIAGFGASPDNGKDGKAVLFDRYGDIGWSASGKH